MPKRDIQRFKTQIAKMRATNNTAPNNKIKTSNKESVIVGGRFLAGHWLAGLGAALRLPCRGVPSSTMSWFLDDQPSRGDCKP